MKYPSCDHDISIITTHEMQDAATPYQGPPHFEEQPPVSSEHQSLLPYRNIYDCESLYDSMVTYNYMNQSYDNTHLKVLRVQKSSHIFCKVEHGPYPGMHILPLHPKLPIKPSAHKNALGIQWEDIAWWDADENRKHKTSIWLRNKSARNALLKLLTDAMTVSAEISPELYIHNHVQIQLEQSTDLRHYED